MRSARLVIPGAIKPKLTRARVLAAMWECLDRCTRHASAYDWSRTHAQRRGGEARKRLPDGEWPSASVVTGWVIVACAIAALPTASGLITLS